MAINIDSFSRLRMPEDGRVILSGNEIRASHKPNGFEAWTAFKSAIVPNSVKENQNRDVRVAFLRAIREEFGDLTAQVIRERVLSHPNQALTKREIRTMIDLARERSFNNLAQGLGLTVGDRPATMQDFDLRELNRSIPPNATQTEREEMVFQFLLQQKPR